jgi:hypothetical protein
VDPTFAFIRNLRHRPPASAVPRDVLRGLRSICPPGRIASGPFSISCFGRLSTLRAHRLMGTGELLHRRVVGGFHL